MQENVAVIRAMKRAVGDGIAIMVDYNQCLAPTAHWLEYVDWWNPIVEEPLSIENGVANLAGAMGTGVAWNESAVQRFTV